MSESKSANFGFGLSHLKTALLKSPKRMFCGECKKYIPSTMDWACAYCGQEHREVRVYTFLNKCRRCKRRPQAFECPHCHTIWGYNNDADPAHPARLLLPSQKQNVSDGQANLKDEKAEPKSETPIVKPKTPMEAIDEDFEKKEASFLGVRKKVRAKRQEYAKEHQNDPEMLADSEEFLRHFERENLP